MKEGKFVILASGSESYAVMVSTQAPLSKDPRFNFLLRHVQRGYGCSTLVVVPRFPPRTLNRGTVCVTMHLRSCMDVREPG